MKRADRRLRNRITGLDSPELRGILDRKYMATIKKRKSEDGQSSVAWPFGRKNYILLGIAVGIIVIGYICLGYGDDPNNGVSITLAPILLVIGYGMIPVAILAKDKPREAISQPELPTQE
jgi:hypothetical protein